LAHARLWFSGKVLFFVITCESAGTVDSMCFPWHNKGHRANEALKQLWFAFLSHLGQDARSLSVFFTTAAYLLQVTTAFVLKIFSFSDKKKV